MTQITKKIYLGSYDDARNLNKLSHLGITHILNTAIEIPNFYPNYFKYLRLNLDDISQQNLYPVLDKSYKFIDNVVNNDGKILVHCAAGISRSSSIVIYYLMKRYNWDYGRAYNYVKSHRKIINPNNGFCRQLRFFAKV